MHSTPSDAIAAQVRQRRQQLNLNRQQLAEKCASVGAPQITAAALTNIETGRRDAAGKRRREVSVEELLALAVALGVFPVDLIVPGEAEEEEPCSVTPEVTTSAGHARRWISGAAWLADPETPLDFAEAIRGMPQWRAQQMSRAWFTPERQRQWNKQALDWDREEQARQAERRGADDDEAGGEAR
jgi:transcriptional regulator with XRE-family HTH domain